MLTLRLAIMLLVTAVAVSARAGTGGWSFDIEGGAVSNGYNDVRIPGNTGTDISLSEELASDETGFVRVRINKRLGERNHVSLLVAPLRLASSGSVDREIDFNGTSFPAGTSLDAKFRFDSYRLTYQRTFYESRKLRLGLGLTAKIRDASISLEGGGLRAEKKNTGFVPLINFGLEWHWSQKTGMILRGDALAAPQGRAEDVLLAVFGRLSDDLQLRAGYRILEGGADNDTVYNFTLIHYASLGLTWSL